MKKMSGKFVGALLLSILVLPMVIGIGQLSKTGYRTVDGVSGTEIDGLKDKKGLDSNITIQKDEEIQIATSAVVRTMEELILAINNPNILEISSDSVGFGVPITSPIIVNRKVRFNSLVLNMGENGRLVVNQNGNVTVGEGGLTLSEAFNRPANKDSWIDIDSGRVSLDGLTLLMGLRGHGTGVSISNNGVLENKSTLGIHGVDVGIRMNGGTFIDEPSKNGSNGSIGANIAIFSESGENRHEFSYEGGLNTGNTIIFSSVGSTIYSNTSDAKLIVKGKANQLGLWSLNFADNIDFWGAPPPEYRLEDINFFVEQIGQERPVIHEINNSVYSHLFVTGVLDRYRGVRSASTETVFPPIRLPEGITVSPVKTNLMIGEAVQLIETLSPDPSQLDNDEVIWVSENPEIAKVDGNGIVTAVGKGETEVKVVTINGLSATAEIRVEDFTFEFSGVDGNSTAVITGYHGTDTEIEIPSTAVNREAGWTTTSTVIGIDDRVFMDKGLTNVLIPDSITGIGESAFYKNKLSTLTIPDTVKSIGQQAFLENNLTELYIGSGVSRLENQVFGLNNLSSIVIPDTIQRIETLAFHSNNLTEVTIPKTVTYLGLRSFENNSLEKVTFEGAITGLGAQVFAQNPLKEIYVEESSLVYYQRELSPNIIRGVTERTLLTVNEPRYSDDTQLINNLMVGDELSFSVLSKNRYQLDNLEAFVWEEFIPNVQWFKDAQALPTETKQQFRIAEVEESDSGSYYAIVDDSELPSLSVEVSPLIQPDIPAINPEDGILDLENTNPVIEGLSLRYVSDLYFDATTFSSSNQTVYANNNDGIPKVTVQDMRSASKRNGWELQVRQNQLFMDGAELIFNPFVHEINQDLLNIKSHNGALTVNTEAQRFAGTTTTGNPSGIATMGMGSVDGSGVSLQIPGGVGVGIYEATLIWNLVATPSTANEHIAGK